LRRPGDSDSCALRSGQSSPDLRGGLPPAARLAAALGIVRGVDAGAVVAARPHATDVPRRLRAARLKALREWMKTL
jgi:hypothetical protein